MLLQQLDAGVLTLTISRPERKNALTQGILRELRDTLRDASVDPLVRVVVLTGDGDIFSAGGDLDAMHALDAQDPVSVRSSASPQWDTAEARGDRIFRNCEAALLLHEMPKPTIAKIRGPAVGAALSLALACDLRYIDPTARFITGFARIGLAGDLGITALLLALVGPALARELMFFSEPLLAERIIDLGLANWLIDSVALDERVAADAARLAEGPGLAYRYIKADLNVASGVSLRRALAVEAANQARCLYSEDAREAGRAYVEKRAPKFQGR